MKNSLRRATASVHPRAAVVLHDLMMVGLAWFVANWLPWNVRPEPIVVLPVSINALLVVLVQGGVLWWTGLYRGLWRFASLPDLWNIARAALLGTLAITLVLFLYTRLEHVPRWTLFLYPLALTVLLGAPRLFYRYWKDSRGEVLRSAPQMRVLVLGAGRSGDALVRDLKREAHLLPVGFLDDNGALRGSHVQGLPVLGTVEMLPRVAEQVAAQMILIAMPSANTQQMRRVVEACEDTGLPFRTLPRLEDVIAGRSVVNELKEVAIEDLLGRQEVSLDWTGIRAGIAGRRVMVTGGGGSIGAELCRQLARLGVESLIVLELSEFNLYLIEQELRREFPDLLLHSHLGDCGDAATCAQLLKRHRPHAVFHAAAFKHVPLLEGQVREAVRNNLLATATLALACDQGGVESFVLISSDKAVNPTNVMGATKRAAEIVCQSLAERSGTRFITVRFGNVLDSAGSVVPLFREQIRQGGPVTVTHPEITRYFMTIPEASQLILQAAVLGSRGEVYALDMGEPVAISYLAEQMVRLANKVPGRDIEIVYTGLRAGEKLFEELFHEHEAYGTTSHPKILLAGPRTFEWNRLTGMLRKMEAASRAYDETAIATMLCEWVPELTLDRRGSVVRMAGEGA